MEWIQPDWQSRSYVILKGYIDESYGPDVFTLSCVMSDLSGWLSINRSWKKCLAAKNESLKSQGRKLIRRFHAKDISNFRNDFENWNGEERLAFFQDLLGVFNRAKSWLNVVSYSTPLELFKEYFPECAAKPLPTCYSLSLKFIMTEIVSQVADGKLKWGKTKPIKITLFHERCPFDGVLLNAFTEALADEDPITLPLFTTIAPMGWEDCLPLQIADLVAYENFKDADRRLKGLQRRGSLTALLGYSSFGGRARTFQQEGLATLRKLIDSKSAL
jgi:hypothetical protein